MEIEGKKGVFINEGTPLTIKLKSGVLTFSKEIQEVVKGTSYDLKEVISTVLGKDISYLEEFDIISDYTSDEIDNILGFSTEYVFVEEKNLNID